MPPEKEALPPAARPDWSLKRVVKVAGQFAGAVASRLLAEALWQWWTNN